MCPLPYPTELEVDLQGPVAADVKEAAAGAVLEVPVGHAEGISVHATETTPARLRFVIGEGQAFDVVCRVSGSREHRREERRRNSPQGKRKVGSTLCKR